MRAFQSNNPYKQCLDWSCVPAYSSYSIEDLLGAEEKAILTILYSRGLLQVRVSKVVFFVPLLGQRLTTGHQSDTKHCMGNCQRYQIPRL